MNTWKNKILLALFLATITLLTVSFTQQGSPISSNNSFVIYGGSIITMSDDEYSMYIDSGGSISGLPLPEAIWVKDGIIKKVGSRTDVLNKAGNDGIEINLEGKTLMPGFVEPHTHLPLLISFSAVTDLSPCLPDPYESRYYSDENAPCPHTLQESFDSLNISEKRKPKDVDGIPGEWIVANGLDPSRLGNKYVDELTTFLDDPAKQLESKITDGSDQPIFILDQSGHVAYVNMQAFVKAGICSQENVDKNNCGPNTMTSLGVDYCPNKKECNGSGLATWAVDDNNKFTGKLLEEPAYTLFMVAISDDLRTPVNGPFFFMTEDAGLKKAPSFINDIAKTGVTTIVNAGGFNKSEVLLFKTLAEQNLDNSKLRYRSLVSADITGGNETDTSKDIADSLKTSTWDETNNGLYGVYGMKWWADGSTQGCSGYLNKNYAQDGICQGEDKSTGRNYSDSTLLESIKPYWGDDWLIQVHANGDAAVEQTLEVMLSLQSLCEFRMVMKPTLTPITLHHVTVGGDPIEARNTISLIEEYRNKTITCRSPADGRDITFPAPLNITVSHTPAHIAYWGGAFESLLDGKGLNEHATGAIEDDTNGRATMIDATQSDIDHGVPFSLHSDVPVSPVNPLWYVEQVVMRNTWFMPNLASAEAKAMPINNKINFGAQNISVYEALRAITIVPAQQNLLHKRLASIEEGKVADLVILDNNPLEIDDQLIHTIKIDSTFVNGVRHNWFEEKLY